MKTETICARVAATALNQGATTAMPRRRIFKKPDTWEYGHDAPADEKPLGRPGKRRAATMLVYGALFFAGAAFTAFAGDQFSHVSQDSQATADSTATDAAASDAAPAGDPAPAPTDAAPADASAPAPADTAPSAAAPAPTDSATDPASAGTAPADATATPADGSADASSATGADYPDALTPTHNSSRDSATAPSGASAEGSTAGSAAATTHHTAHAAQHAAAASPFVLLPKVHPAPKPELEGPAASSTVWLNRALPDSTPPALRLAPKFAQRLRTAAQSSGIDWALLLGVLRAKGATGHTPAGTLTLNRVADRLATMQKSAGGE